MPALFAFGLLVIGNPALATFAAFGAFAMLLLADFGGTLAERLAAQASLVVVGCALIALATLVSGNPWVAATAMFVVGFVVLFVGVVSSALAAASTATLLSFILPVATPAAPAATPDRVLGWLLAGAVSLPAVTLLWPAPRSEPLRDAAAEACLDLSGRLNGEVARWRGEDGEGLDAAVARSHAAVAALRATFLATPYRPSGLTTATRAVVRLVDEVIWLSLIMDDAAVTRRRRRPADPSVRQVKAAAAVLLEHAGKALSAREPPQDSLQDHLDDLARARRSMEKVAVATVELPRGGDTAEDLVASLGPGFRAQELSSAVRAIAENIEIITTAEERTWWQNLLGRHAPGREGPIASARRRLLAHVEPHSVWLRNSVRGGIALGAAVLIANLSGAQHSFWIVLGALSVLRSNAVSTGQSAIRGLLGTVIGFAIGGVLVLLLGSETVLLWVLLPFAILVAGIAPAVSFVAGQAGFTVALLVLFNIVSPAGWEVGLVRIEDVGIGCAVSLVVGAVFWPRGAAGALRQALAEAYGECAAYLRTAAESGTAVDGTREQTGPAASRAAAAARRLDDAFREYLAERGRKQLSLAEVASLLTGVVGLRLTAEAVSHLCAGEASRRIDSPRAQLEVIVTTERVTNWYAAMAQALTGAGPVPRALPQDGGSTGRLVQALGQDLDSAASDASLQAHTVRLVWTSDHVDGARRLQGLVEQPARAAARHENVVALRR